MSGKYSTIVIDPAWDIPLSGITKRRPDTAKELPYQTMSLDEIKAFPLQDYANPGAHIYCWTTNKMLRATYEVFDAWRVKFHLIIVMAKPSGIAPSMGYVFGTEFCMLGFFEGTPQKFKSIGALNWFKHQNLPGQHSRKPNRFYALVERMSPAPYIDIFSRRRRYGWDSYGNEVPEPIPTIEQFQT